MDPIAFITLAATAFLAATVVPLSSEAAVVAALALGAEAGPVFAAASIGNCLGALSTVGLGWLFAARATARLHASQRGTRALAWAERYGAFCLLASWLPLIGDVVLLAAGVFRLRWWAIIGFGLGTRVARYALVIWVYGAA